MNEQEQYETLDMPFYRAELAPRLPPKVLDFHTHLWRRDQWCGVQAGTAHASAEVADGQRGARYMSTTLHYDADDLLRDGQRMFPDRPYHAVCFGQPHSFANTEATNAYVAESGRRRGLYPLLVVGRDMLAAADLRRQILDHGFFGFKVFLNWRGNDYGNVCVEDMIGPVEMTLANELHLVVLLHVPRAERLADPEVQRGVGELSRRYPAANIVLAHCGRCYLPSEMKRAIASVRDLDKVYLDTSMVMDPIVLRMVFDTIASNRVLFATDLPIAAMRGRRVAVMDHWVDLVLEGYPTSDYRVGFNGMRATFMTYEIALAIIIAAEGAGLSDAEIRRIFYENGMNVLGNVQGGKALAAAQKR